MCIHETSDATSPQQDEVVITVQRELTLEWIDLRWRSLSANRDEHQPIAIRMDRCEFVHPSALLYLLAQISGRLWQDEPKLTITLPRSDRVRTFMSTYRFAEALADVLGQHPSQVFKQSSEPFEAPGDTPDHTGSLPAIAEDHATKGGLHARDALSPYARSGTHNWAEAVAAPVADRGGLLPRFFFPLQVHYAIEGSSGSNLIAAENRRWQQRYLMSVLNRILVGHATQVRSHIVHEALLNAVHHPRARLVATCSTYDENEVAIMIWDDGSSIIDTLRHALNEGRKLRLERDIPSHLEIKATIEDLENGQSHDCSFSSDYTPDAATDDASILIGAIMPGISSDFTTRLLPSVSDAEAEAAPPGWGLYTLANAVIETFGGDLEIRTGEWSMRLYGVSVPRPEPHFTYRARMRNMGVRGRFRGNMLTVHLPRRSGSEE